MTRTKNCPICGNDFSYEVGQGNDRKYCSAECRVSFKIANAKERFATLPKCRIDGCKRPANRQGMGVCEVHYCRHRRTGAFASRPLKKRYVTGAGYIKVLLPSHELADSYGHVYEHRLVAYEKNKGGHPMCFWCASGLTWESCVVDHLNEKKADNRPENLVTACNNCNRARGAMLPFVKRMSIQSLPVFLRLIRKYHETQREMNVR